MARNAVEGEEGIARANLDIISTPNQRNLRAPSVLAMVHVLTLTCDVTHATDRHE